MVPVACIAIGYPGEPAALPSDLHEREQPNTRKSVREFVFEGRYETKPRQQEQAP